MIFKPEQAPHLSPEGVPTMVFGRKLAETCRERPGAYLLAKNEQGHIAIIQSKNYHFLPGGGIEEGETDTEALLRELREECGRTTDTAALTLSAIGEYYAFIPQGKPPHIHFIARIYTGTLSEAIAPPTEKGNTLLWLPPEEAVKKLYFKHQAWAVGYLTKQ